MMGTSSRDWQGPSAKEGNKVGAGADAAKILPWGWEGVQIIHGGRSTQCRPRACPQPELHLSFVFAGGNDSEKSMCMSSETTAGDRAGAAALPPVGLVPRERGKGI